MAEHARIKDRSVEAEMPADDATDASNWVFGCLCVLLFGFTFLVSGPWTGFHALLFGAMALLILRFPSRVALPTSWWVLAGAFVLAASAVFLPAHWFGIPDWRNQLDVLGVRTGSQVAIQSRMAVETLALFSIMILGGFWMAGHRPTQAQLRFWSLMFTVGVATYAVISKIALDMPIFAETSTRQRFGFFPNRNHTATYLSMGAICGLGCTLQALRDKRFAILAIALAATAICLWAIASWSISRAGVVLVTIGGLLWVVVLGRRYLGRHGLWATALIAITAAGLFLIADTQVRERISSTVEKTGTIMTLDAMKDPQALKADLDRRNYLDFRIPIFLDTLELIRNHGLTGVGAGQFYHVFPQYRDRTIIANGSDVHHPESDWLLMAAEVGLPATLALLALVSLACAKSLLDIRHGRDRALRAGCLIAAMLVPIHGCFDVPGHRITLAWSAVFLFALSLQSYRVHATSARGGSWRARAFAGCLLAISLYLARAQWFDGPQPDITTATHAITRAQQLHQQDLTHQEAARDAGLEYQPAPEDDPLEKALALMGDASERVPLDYGLRRFSGFVALHFDDRAAFAAECFAIERRLHPSWVGGPLGQAEAWSASHPDQSRLMWMEALRRASEVDKRDSGNRWGRNPTRSLIDHFIRSRPELAPFAPPAD